LATLRTVYELASETSAIPAATGLRSIYAEMARSDSSSSIAMDLSMTENPPTANRPDVNSQQRFTLYGAGLPSHNGLSQLRQRLLKRLQSRGCDGRFIDSQTGQAGQALELQ
jgi:hypothetical protein